MRKDFERLADSTERWQALKDTVEKSGPKFKRSRLVEEIMLQFAYPRLDINVSKGLNHLLKSPFCVHPKTGKNISYLHHFRTRGKLETFFLGRVCIPIDPAKVDSFDPIKVPTISQLTDEIDAFSKDDTKSVAVSKDWKKTSLREPIKIFEEFLSKLSETWRGKRMEKSDMSMEF